VNERERLDNRRQSITLKLVHGVSSRAYFLTHDDALEPHEFFLDGAKTGSEYAALMHDAATAASLARQYGCPLSVLAGAMGRDPVGEPISILARAVDEAKRYGGSG
jgi:hypothetical protein